MKRSHSQNAGQEGKIEQLLRHTEDRNKKRQILCCEKVKEVKEYKWNTVKIRIAKKSKKKIKTNSLTRMNST